MSETVFYAWQSDHPDILNRTFIRDCIKRAVKRLNAELGIEDAIRADQDTQGVPGDVSVAEVIFEKIDQCRIFVADVTTVSAPDAVRPTPNPNVLIEYGRASIRPGSSSVVTIFNEAFGDWKLDRPFDMKHRRPPLVYRMDMETSGEQKRQIREKLVTELTDVFRMLIAWHQREEVLPSVGSFSDLREFYWETSFQHPSSSRIVGFWAGLIPLEGAVAVSSPWDHEEIFERERTWNFGVKGHPTTFKVMDADISEMNPVFQPFQGGAKFIRQYHYPLDHSGRRYFDDSVGVFVTENGHVALAVRTNNLEPLPHLRRESIIADVANCLIVADRVRKLAGRPTADYAMVLELRYDDPGDNPQPVPSGEWQLVNLGDEDSLTGPLLDSDPLMIGPMRVAGPDSFPTVLQNIHTKLITSAGRLPEPDTDFTGISHGLT